VNGQIDATRAADQEVSAALSSVGDELFTVEPGKGEVCTALARSALRTTADALWAACRRCRRRRDHPRRVRVVVDSMARPTAPTRGPLRHVASVPF
jgi:hypothetical protein